jgi:hypothetical protein
MKINYPAAPVPVVEIKYPLIAYVSGGKDQPYVIYKVDGSVPYVYWNVKTGYNFKSTTSPIADGWVKLEGPLVLNNE